MFENRGPKTQEELCDESFSDYDGLIDHISDAHGESKAANGITEKSEKQIIVLYNIDQLITRN